MGRTDGWNQRAARSFCQHRLQEWLGYAQGVRSRRASPDHDASAFAQRRAQISLPLKQDKLELTLGRKTDLDGASNSDDEASMKDGVRQDRMRIQVEGL